MMAGRLEALGETLTRHYRLSCELFNTFPQPHFTLQLSRGCLELRLDAVDLDHLEALCHTIKNKVSPSHLRIYVPIDKKVAARVVERAVEGVAVCVVASLTLTTLALDGVRLRGRTLKLLCEGVRKARTLKTLHLEKCDLGDSGTENVCQAIKNVPSITHLSLVDCGMEERGATAIACLIKHQRLNRDSAMWQDTLRQRQPYLDGMKGLRRLTLNHNPALGDQGAAAIAEVLAEDLWIKAVDLQHCGLGVGGGASLCALLHTNQTVEVVDVRNNPFLPDKVLGELTDLLQGRQTEASAQYSWLKISQVEDEAVEEHQKRGRNTVGYRTSGRAVKGRRARQSPHVPTSSRRPKVPSQFGVPWRVEHRLYERREGLAPGSMLKEHFWEQQQSIRAASQPPRESPSEGEVTVMKMRRKLQHYRKKYQKEHERRQKLERKLSRIQTQLKGLHTLDEATITHIEECFLKFQIFLSMMQNSGEHLQTSSSGAASPLPHPPEPDSTHIPPGSSLPQGTFFPNPPFSVPVPVFMQQPFNETTSLSHPVLAPAFDSVQGRHSKTKRTTDESELSSQNRDSAMNLNPSRDERNPVSQGHSFHRNNSEMSKKSNSDLEAVASHQHINDLPGSAPHDAMDGRNSRDEAVMKQQQISKKMHNKVNKGKPRKEGIRSGTEENDPVPIHSPSKAVKQKQTVGTQVTNDIIEWDIAEAKKSAINAEPRSPTNIDTFTMRVEFEDVNGGMKTGKTKCINEKEIHNMKENKEHEVSFHSGNPSLKKSNIMKEIHTLKDQRYLENNSPEEIKLAQEACISTTRSPGLEANQTPQDSQSLQESKLLQSSQSFQASQLLQSRQPLQTSQSAENSQSLQPIQPLQGSQSLHTSQSYSSQSHEIKSVEESQLPQQTPSSPRISPQLIQSCQESQSPRSYSLSSQSVPSQSPPSQSPHSQSPHSQSPLSQSPSSQPPQESHSPKRNQLHQKQSPQKLKTSQSPHKIHPSQDQESHLPPKTKSPKKSRSSKEHLGGEVQASEVSETDDEKMRNLSAWLHGGMRGRASTPSSSSSLSISEQLQLSHSSWTKGQGHHGHKEGGKKVEELPKGREVEEVHGESEFEFDASDLEDLSISGITLTNTSVPEDIHTPGEEDF